MPLQQPVTGYHSFSVPLTSNPPRTAGKPPLPPPPRLPPAPAPQTLFTRARAQIPAFRPWRELAHPSSFSIPYSYAEAMSRVRRNLNYFRMNYAVVMLFLLFCSLIFHPISMITFLVISLAWMGLCFFRADPILVFGRTLDDRIVMIILSLITVVALVFTSVGLNILVALILGVLILGLHGAFRGVEDLFLDESEAAAGGLVSVVSGGEPRTSRRERY